MTWHDHDKHRILRQSVQVKYTSHQRKVMSFNLVKQVLFFQCSWVCRGCPQSIPHLEQSFHSTPHWFRWQTRRQQEISTEQWQILQTSPVLIQNFSPSPETGTSDVRHSGHS